LIGRRLMVTIGIVIFSSVWAMERGRCVGVVPTSHRVGLQMYCRVISITCILTWCKWRWKDVLGMIGAVADLCAVGGESLEGAKMGVRPRRPGLA